MESPQHASSAKAILYAFIANLGIALAKSWAAWFTSSGSMLAEAIHSYADCGNQLLLFIGLRQSTQPPDSEHPSAMEKSATSGALSWPCCCSAWAAFFPYTRAGTS
jgi:divalent metal cation (Fe/Co/Zn/Cd) transporter